MYECMNVCACVCVCIIYEQDFLFSSLFKKYFVCLILFIENIYIQYAETINFRQEKKYYKYEFCILIFLFDIILIGMSVYQNSYL